MDPLTHTLTGLALSRAGLNRLTPHATPILLLAANAPDVDVILAPFGAVPYLHYHRHITHALIAIPLMALLSVLVVRLFARKRFLWRGAAIAALAGAVSHPVLDWWNVYGIRLLLPFSDEWLRLDLVNLPDVWVWAILLLGWLMPAFSRLVSSEMGAKPGSGRGAAIFALLLVTLYVGGRAVLHQRAIAVLDARMYEGVAPVRVAAFPGPVNPFAWRGLVDGGSFYGLYDVNLLHEFDPTLGRLYYKTIPGEREMAAVRAARETETFRVFLDFSQFPLWRFEPAEEVENGLRVQAVDLRFGTPLRPAFEATAVVDGTGRVRRSWFSFRPD